MKMKSLCVLLPIKINRYINIKKVLGSVQDSLYGYGILVFDRPEVAGLSHTEGVLSWNNRETELQHLLQEVVYFIQAPPSK